MAKEKNDKKTNKSFDINENEKQRQTFFSKSLDENIGLIKELFSQMDTITYKNFSNCKNSNLKFCLVSARGMVRPDIISDSVIRPLMENHIQITDNLAHDIAQRFLYAGDVYAVKDTSSVAEAVTYGDSLLLISGSDQILIIGAKQFPTRAITEPDSEKVIKGPREGFTECVTTNLSMMYRKIRTNDFKAKLFSCGMTSNTQIAVCYMDSSVNKKILQLLLKKLEQAKIDNVLDSNYISELVRGDRLTPFKTVGSTERPDALAGKILEGRIGILVDGSPVALSLPRLFIENFQNPEDYYVNYYYASFSRILRMLAFILSIATPAVYIAIVAFHHEMVPTNLLINITLERQNVPLPAAFEAVIMLIVFDILRETGVRMPQGVGQALSIVGALVIGQSAVEAKLVAAPMIIVIALTGITSLLVPKISGAIIICRFFLLGLATVLGFVGLTIGFALILIHLFNLKSFGIPQMSPLSTLKFYDVKDVFVRAPIWKMKTGTKAVSNKKTGIIE